MLSIGLMLALAQTAVSPKPSSAVIAATQSAGCEGCAPDSWQFRGGKWYWWSGSRFTYYWHAGTSVRTPGTPARTAKPAKPPALSLKLKRTSTVFPDRPQ